MQNEILIGDLLDNVTFSLTELAQACLVDERWVLEHVEAGMMRCVENAEAFNFLSADLIRARQLISIERTFDINAESAALMADLIEEINQLRQQLSRDN